MAAVRKMPIGGQNFEDLRKKKFIYIDKTQYVSQLLGGGKFYFLSRPRRFGKSLFLSTLEAYFLGKKELFKGLYLEKAEEELALQEEREAWLEYPVFYLDLCDGNYTILESLSVNLNDHLSKWETIYGIDPSENDFSTRFRGVIQRAFAKTGRQVVILIDEYDKPLLDSIDNPEINNYNREILKAFYSVIKSSDQYLRFAFLTGVTKFSKVSVFSGLNNLKDLSLRTDFADICGITEGELERNFAPEIEKLAVVLGETREKTLAMLKKKYDGYLFAKHGANVYNPFSLLNAFDAMDLCNYWYATGTPTFLVKFLKEAHYELFKLEGDVMLTADGMDHYTADSRNALPILYQAGYLTIKEYVAEGDIYRLGFPNDEVRYAFLNNLLPAYTSLDVADTGLTTWEFLKAIKAGDVEGVMTRIQSLLASIPYISAAPEEAIKLYERDYQAVIYIIFTLLGQFVQTEVRNATGRADCIVHTQETIFIFEFKLWSIGTPEEALAQIRTKGYALPYRASSKRIVLIGASFDEQKRTIGAWKEEEL